VAVKKCSKCEEEKDISEYVKSNISKDGLAYVCKSCSKKWREANKEKAKEYRKVYREQNKEKIAKRCKSYNETNKDKIYKYNKEYGKTYNAINKDKINERAKLYGKQNRKKISKYYKEYRDKNHLFKMSTNLRSRTYLAFKRRNWHKEGGTEKMLGCSFETAHKHLERQFTKGMSWENQGEWHVDHIIPLASAKTEEDLINLCHYTNLQPLWAEDNLSKGASIDNQQGKLRL